MPSYFFHLVFDLERVALFQNLSQQPRDHSDSSIAPTINTERSLGNARRNLERTHSNLPTLSDDWRYDKIAMQDIAIRQTPSKNRDTASESEGQLSHGLSAGPGGLATKGKYEPLDSQHEELGWGVVRLYRDSAETPGLYDDPEPQKHSKNAKGTSKKSQVAKVPFRDEDCTTLCILAVPSYLAPSDFLGFVGEKTRDEVSHFRMIRTERGNRYMVLMKFRSGKKAREWRKVWNGKPFDGMDVSLESQD